VKVEEEEMKIRNLALILITALYLFGSFAYADLPVLSNLMARYSVDSFSGSSDGEPVNAWTNSAGNPDLDLTSLGSVTPVYTATGFNGGPSVRFSTNTPMGTLTNIGLTGDPEFTVVFVGTITSLSGQGFTHSWTWGDGSAATGKHGGAADFEIQNTNSGLRVDFATGSHRDAISSDGSFNLFLGKPVVVTFSRTPGPLNSTTRIRINGIGLLLDGSDLTPEIIDTPFYIAPTSAQYAASPPDAMEVAEVIIYNRALSEFELSEMENQLCETYGLGFCGAREQCALVTTGLTNGWAAEGNGSNIAGDNHGTLINGTVFSSGIVGQAFSMDGQGASVVVTDDLSLTPSNISVSAWIIPSSYTFAAPIVKKAGDGTCSNGGYALEFSGSSPYDRIKFWIFDGGWRSSGASVPIPLNTWSHVAGVFDGQQVSLYVNGVLSSGYATAPNIVPSHNPLNIGRDPAYLERLFHGSIDEVMIYNRALEPGEIADIFLAGNFGVCKEQLDTDNDGIPNVSDNCPATLNPDQQDTDEDLYGDACDSCPFDEENDADGDGVCGDIDVCPAGDDNLDADGDNVPDACDISCSFASSGIISWWPGDENGEDLVGGNHGFIHGATLTADGQVNGSFSFDGEDDYIRFSASNLPEGDRTVAFWFYTNDVSINRLLFGYGGNDNNPQHSSFLIYFASADKRRIEVHRHHSGGEVLSYNSDCPMTNAWFHLAFTTDSNGAVLYINGQPVSSSSVVVSTYVSDRDGFIGAAPSGSGIGPFVHYTIPFFKGLIDEVMIYNRALEPGEIADIFSAARLGVCRAPADTDGDGVPDDSDNCKSIVNSGQDDFDADGSGDVCDPDDDNDGVLDSSDNCQFMSNADQLDHDQDLIGDICDEDDDNDGILDESDNCPFNTNPDQSDLDRDGLGDVCDEDPDGDGVIEGDNCPYTPNPYQEDNDVDGQGDACDEDDDNDGILDEQDNCPSTVNLGQEDLDQDNIGDACDIDIDGDGIVNDSDNCLLTANVGQEDTDLDLFGDACDDDDDNDGILDPEDNCSLIYNPDQSDHDEDGQGDVCDEDLDGDGVANEIDNCPYLANGKQNDFDDDGFGDSCDDDIDGDSVLNGVDECEFTPINEIVDPSNGCAIEQLVPCEGPRGTTEEWKNHGKYVSTMAHTTKNWVDEGLITQDERTLIMQDAASSDCGH